MNIVFFMILSRVILTIRACKREPFDPIWIPNIILWIRIQVLKSLTRKIPKRITKNPFSNVEANFRTTANCFIGILLKNPYF